jgi:hypothetical protein
VPALPKSRSRPAAAPARKPVRRPFELDRTVLIRAAFVIVLVLFLYMILRVSMIAFGGSATREAKRIENQIEPPRVRAPDAAKAPAAKASPPAAP